MPILTTPNDPLFGNAWHLLNVGGVAQGNGTAGADIRVSSAWQKYTGKGVLVGVLDDGVELTHPDLAANIWTRPGNITLVDPANANLTIGAPVTPGTDDAADNHGTPVAGVIAAVANNGVGGVGVAPDARLVSYRTLGADSASADLCFQQALNDGVHVLNNSWGADGAFNNPGAPILNAIAALGTQGRGGLGTIIAFAEGNQRDSTVSGQDRTGTDGGLDLLTGNRFVIAVAATDNNGIITDYSTRGSNLLISAPGGAGDGNLTTFRGILATDRVGPDNGSNTNPSPGGDYTGFNGTSAATPVLSGVAALMLEANPGLGYRDVQEIFAYTARQVDVAAGTTGHTSMNRSAWVTTHAGNANGGGLNFSTDYGFGLVDAGAAVRLAETWTAVRTEANLITTTAAAATTGVITTGGIGAEQNFSTTFAVTQPQNSFTGFRVNRLEVDLSLTATLPSELTITLTSPLQTTITMVRTPGNAFTFLGNDNYDGNAPTAWPAGGFTMATPGFWGEAGVGTWTLTVSAAANAAASSLTGATLRLFGDSSAGGAADLRLTDILTDDFARLANLSAARATFGAGGETGINASAMTSANFIDLNGGSGNLGGRAITLTGNTLRDFAGGASEDTALGNALDNRLSGGWGRDVLYSFGGNDTLNGGSEIDMLFGGAGADFIDGGADFDFARYDDSAIGVVVRLDVGVGLNGDAQGDTVIRCEGLMGSAQTDFLIGDANLNILFGLNGDDWVFGQGGEDYLYGGAGSDQILGGSGSDWLYGEAGNDQFWFLVADFEVGVFDRIMDFAAAPDNTDFIRFEGLTREAVIITQQAGYVHITTAVVGDTGGVVIFGATTAQLNDVITFA